MLVSQCSTQYLSCACLYFLEGCPLGHWCVVLSICNVHSVHVMFGDSIVTLKPRGKKCAPASGYGHKAGNSPIFHHIYIYASQPRWPAIFVKSMDILDMLGVYVMLDVKDCS